MNSSVLGRRFDAPSPSEEARILHLSSSESDSESDHRSSTEWDGRGVDMPMPRRVTREGAQRYAQELSDFLVTIRGRRGSRGETGSGPSGSPGPRRNAIDPSRIVREARTSSTANAGVMGGWLDARADLRRDAERERRRLSRERDITRRRRRYLR